MFSLQNELSLSGATKKKIQRLKKSPVTIADLQSGCRIRITEAELSALTGESRAKFQKLRYLGKPPVFERDPVSGRVFYAAETILAYLSVPEHRSTSEYHAPQRDNIEKARK